MKSVSLKVFVSIVFFAFLSSKLFAQTPKIDSLQKLLSSAKLDTAKASLMSQIAWEIKITDPEKSKELADKTLELSLKTNYEITEAAAYNLYGVYYYFKHDDKPARQNFEKALKLYNKLDYTKGIASCFSNISNILTNAAQFDSAIYYQKKALEYRLKLKLDKPIADSYTNLGNIYNLKGDYSASIDNIFKALKLYEKLNDTNGKGLSYYNIARTYYMQKRNKEAILYAKKSREEREKVPDKSGVALAYLMEAAANEQMHNMEEATKLINNAIVIQKEIGDKYNLQYSYSILGNIFYDYRQIDLALEYLMKSKDMAVEMNNKQSVAGLEYSIGAIYQEKGDFDKAIAHELSSINIAREIGAKEELKKGYFSIQETYARMKKFDKAYEYMDLYTNLNDTLMNEANSTQLNQLQTQYETEKKQKEIELFKKTTEIQKEKIARQNIVTYSVVFGLLLVLVLAFISYKRYREKKRANVEITHQKEVIEVKNKEIVDSIHYAKRIQRALLASESLLRKNLPEFFVLYKPKDIVSGDFYWAAEVANTQQFILATCDCTGHGVPGAFMSLLNISKLSETINDKQITRPDLILNEVRTEIIHALNPNGTEQEARDGMDAVLCLFDFSKMSLQFAAANNPVIIVRDNAILEFKPDKYPVGMHQGELKPFNVQSVELKKGDCVYTFTDGFPDQFGGEKGKKFMSKNFKDVLLSISSKPLNIQKEDLDGTFESWKSGYEQVDDVLVIGVRV